MNIKKSYIFIEKNRDEMTLVFESMANVDIIKPREMPFILMSSEHLEAVSLRDIYEYQFATPESKFGGEEYLT